MSLRAHDVPYGPAPWHQTSWDVRAAGNFIGGGSGSGLIVFTALVGVTGTPRTMLLIAGMALVALGLASVALELGRPLRALNVFRNPGTSWMSREAIVGALLMAVTAAAVLVPGSELVAAAVALAFMYCQARLLQAARGIPAWREPAVIAVLIATALAEGAGLFALTAPLHGALTVPVIAALAVLLVVRGGAFRIYRERIVAAAPKGSRAIDAAARPLIVGGTLAPLALIGLALIAPAGMVAPLAALAGLAATAAGWVLKFVIVTRAGFNRGFALAQLPVRGARP